MGLNLAVLRPDRLQMQMCDTKFQSSLDSQGFYLQWSGPSRVLSGPTVMYNGRALLGPLRVLIYSGRVPSGPPRVPSGPRLDWSGPFIFPLVWPITL